LGGSDALQVSKELLQQDPSIVYAAESAGGYVFLHLILIKLGPCLALMPICLHILATADGDALNELNELTLLDFGTDILHCTGRHTVEICSS
jgi:hypothetical protein